jgi:hypothetical protein
MKTILAAMNFVERYPGEVRGLLTHISNYAPAFRQAAELPGVTSFQTRGEQK